MSRDKLASPVICGQRSESIVRVGLPEIEDVGWWGEVDGNTNLATLLIVKLLCTKISNLRKNSKYMYFCILKESCLHLMKSCFQLLNILSKQ